MDFEDRKRMLNRIITGYTPVIFLNNIYFIYDATPQTEHLAEFYLNKNFNPNDFLDDKETKIILQSKQLWSEVLEKELTLLQKDQSVVRERITELKFKSNERGRQEKILAANEKRCEKLIKQKESLSNFTADYFRRILKYKYLLFLNTYIDGKRVWENLEEFENTVDNFQLNYLMQKSYFNSEFNEPSIREIARTEPWRVMWRASTKSGSLFSGAASEMTDYQRALVSWSLLYDNVYESMDCPDDSVINNDEELDNWLIEQSNKRKKERKKKSLDSLHSNYGEVGIVAETEEDARRIYELNNPDYLNKVRAREEQLLKQGTVQEQHFADSQQKIKMLRSKK